MKRVAELAPIETLTATSAQRDDFKRVSTLLHIYAPPAETSDYPLLFETPIFIVNGIDADCPFWSAFPPDMLPPKDVTNICFVCDFIDQARFTRGYAWSRLIEIVEKIESFPARKSKRKTA